MLSLIVLLFVAAICLFLAEVFILGWVLSILGGLALATALTLTYVQYGFAVGTITFFTTAMVGIAGFAIWMRVFPKTAMGKRLINDSVAGSSDNSASYSLEPGQEGVAVTDLRPAGTGRFGNQRVDVVSEAIFISKDEKICITQVAGSRVVVRPLESFQT